MIKLFTYGTLMESERMSSVIGRPIEGEKFTLSFVHLSPLSHNPMYYQMGHTYNEEDKVTGIVYDITEEEWLLVDKYETLMYIRDNTEVDGIVYWFYTESNYYEKIVYD